jgi:hypothetical protein
VLDHLIVGEAGYTSLLERGLMPVAEGGRRAWAEGW